MKLIGILIGMTMIALAIYYIYRIKKDVKAEEVSEVHIDNHNYRDYVCRTVQEILNLILMILFKKLTRLIL